MASKVAIARLSNESVQLLEWYLKQILSTHKQYADLRNKMTSIDSAYFRYISTLDGPLTTEGAGAVVAAGVDQGAADTEAGATEGEIKVPVVISQVGSFAGYLADVYLSGYPLFPVVSEPANKAKAEMLESIVDAHSLLGGGYARQFVMSFFDGVKYNFAPFEYSWDPIEQYEVVADALQDPEAAKRLKGADTYYTRVKRWCPYNTVWDYRVDPAQVSADGEFIGHIELVSRIPLKRFINRYSSSNILYNISKLDTTKMDVNHCFYQRLPQVSRLVTQNAKSKSEFDWMSWMTTGLPTTLKMDDRRLHAGIYEKFTCYARIIPKEFKIYGVPKPAWPAIWKFCFINGQHLISAEPVFGAYDLFPAMIAQPLEDSFGVQTESIGEGQIPIQEAATKLFSIRFNSARRAVSDRALYDPMMINSSDVNSRSPAAKIPLRVSGLNDKTMEAAYKQIPFDSRGTESLIGDVRNILEMGNMLSGLNRPSQGQFQKGNKSVEEWRDTMSGADNRIRLPALMLEFQMMIPLKNQLKLNIFQHGATGVYQSRASGAVHKVDAKAMQELRDAVLSFRIADGFTPKSKMASTEFITQLLQIISQSEVLQQTMGQMLPGMVTHLAQLGGVRGLEQYLPPQQPQQQQGGTSGTGLPTPAVT